MRFKFEKPRFMSQIAGTFRAAIRQRITKKLIVALEAFQDSLRDTPVYSGQTLANFQWSIGRPASGVLEAVETPLLTGKTSKMKLGNEPRRAANQAVMEASFRNMIATLNSLTTLETTIYLVNNAPHFELVEYGSYDLITGTVARTPPQGMVRLGEMRFKEIMGRSARRVA